MIAARLSPGAISKSSSKPLSSQRGFQVGETGDVPARAVEPSDDAAGDGIAHARKDYWDRPRLPLEGNGRRGPCCYDDVGLRAHQLLRKRVRIRLMSARPHRRSIRALRPSVQPKSASPCVSAERRTFRSGSFSSPPISKPMRRTRSPCCARATTGHAAALPSPVMNVRRPIIGSPRRRWPTAFPGW